MPLALLLFAAFCVLNLNNTEGRINFYELVEKVVLRGKELKKARIGTFMA